MQRKYTSKLNSYLGRRINGHYPSGTAHECVRLRHGLCTRPAPYSSPNSYYWLTSRCHSNLQLLPRHLCCAWVFTSFTLSISMLRTAASVQRVVAGQCRSSRRQLAVQLHRHSLHCSRLSRDDVPGHCHPSFKLSARSDFVAEHNQNNSQSQRTDAPRALRAARALQAGETIHRFHSATMLAAEASHWTLQIGPTEHIDLSHHVLRNINHACKPNVKLKGLVAPPRGIFFSVVVGDSLSHFFFHRGVIS